MATATETETHKAAKPHRCEWCWTRILAGETYQRYRYYDGGDAGTVKMHPECYSAMQETAKQEGGWTEWMPGDNPRGCNCGHDRGCERCATHLTHNTHSPTA